MIRSDLKEMSCTFLIIQDMCYSSSACCVPDTALILYIYVNPHKLGVGPIHR